MMMMLNSYYKMLDDSVGKYSVYKVGWLESEEEQIKEDEIYIYIHRENKN